MWLGRTEILPLTEIQGFDIYNIGENNAKTTCKNNTI